MKIRKRATPRRMIRVSPALLKTRAGSESVRELSRNLAGIVPWDSHTHVTIEMRGSDTNEEARRCVLEVRACLIEVGIPADLISTREPQSDERGASLLMFPGEPRRPQVVIVIEQDEQRDAA